MSKLSLFNFGPHEVRELERNSEPWFVAKDVCRALGLDNHREALRGLSEDERGSVVLTTLGGKQELSLVNEPGLYRLVFRSRKPEAEKFKRWIAHEVLPSIRKRGVYVLESRVAELAHKIEVRTDMYFDAVADLRKQQERYRKSHTPVSERERGTIRGLLAQRKGIHEVAELSCRSIQTVRKIAQEIGA